MTISGRKSFPGREKSKYKGSEAGMRVTWPSKSRNANEAEPSEGAGWLTLSLEKQAESDHAGPCWLYSGIWIISTVARLQ